MRKISRWYNIEVIFEGPIFQETYVAQISRKTIKRCIKSTSAFRFHQV
jgi:hypothetical protein